MCKGGACTAVSQTKTRLKGWSNGILLAGQTQAKFEQCRYRPPAKAIVHIRQPHRGKWRRCGQFGN